MEYGIFNDDAANYTSEESVESGFYSIESAKKAIADRYSEEDELTIHEIEEPEDDEEEEDGEDDE